MDVTKLKRAGPLGPSGEDLGFDRNADETIDVNAAAKLLHCDFEQVEFLARRGEIPATKIGRGWIFLRTQLIDSIAERAKNEAQTRRAGRPHARAAPDDPAPDCIEHSPRPRGRPRKNPLPVAANPYGEMSTTRASEPNLIRADSGTA